MKTREDSGVTEMGKIERLRIGGLLKVKGLLHGGLETCAEVGNSGFVRRSSREGNC
jgi:hypothetical protein